MVIGSTGTWKGPFGYSGSASYQEDETGLQLLGHRYYDSSTGRFITRDRIKDGRNWYSYCDNNPVNAIDADGLKKQLVIILGDYSGLGIVTLLTYLKDKYGEEYDIKIVDVKSEKEVEDLLVSADAVIMIGHGAPFVIGSGKRSTTLKNSTLNRAAARRKKAGKGLLDFMLLFVCGALADPADRAAYLQLTKHLYGFSDNCTVYWGTDVEGLGGKMAGSGKWWTNPTVKIGGGGVRPGGGYTNVRLP